jgi:hypothetical protein
MQDQSTPETEEQPTFSLPTWLGDVSHLEKYSPVICSDHADELRQNFRIGGIEAFGKSTAAGMLDRAELFSAGTRPCTRCGGHVWTGEEDSEPERSGCGFVPSHSARNRAVTAKQAEFLALLDIEASTVPIMADLPCPDCECRGWVQTGRHATGPLTARPTGSSKKGEPIAANMDIDLQILAVCGRRLERADCLLPIASISLAAQFEPGGGNLMAQWALVPAGKTWLRQNKTGIPPSQFFAAARISQEVNHDAKVDAVIRACDEQGRALLNASGCAWNAAVALELQERAA